MYESRVVCRTVCIITANKGRRTKYVIEFPTPQSAGAPSISLYKYGPRDVRPTKRPYASKEIRYEY
jgi:hypothetical protein